MNRFFLIFLFSFLFNMGQSCGLCQMTKNTKLELANFAKNLRAEGAIVSLNYNKELNSIGINQMLIPENILTSERLFQSKIRSLKLFGAIRTFRNNFIKLFDDAEDNIYSLNIPQKDKVEFLEGFLTARGKTLKKVFQFISNQEDLAVQYLLLINFLNKRVGTFSTDSTGKFIFKNPKDEIEFGRLANGIIALANEETALNLEFKKQNKFEKIIEELEK